MPGPMDLDNSGARYYSRLGDKYSVTQNFSDGQHGLVSGHDKSTVRISRSTAELTIKPHGLLTRAVQFIFGPSNTDKQVNHMVRASFENDLRQNFRSDIVDEVLGEIKYFQDGQQTKPLTMAVVRSVCEKATELQSRFDNGQVREKEVVFVTGDGSGGVVHGKDKWTVSTTSIQGDLALKEPKGRKERTLQALHMPQQEKDDNLMIRNKFAEEVRHRYGDEVADEAMLHFKYLQQGKQGPELAQAEQPLTVGTVRQIWERAAKSELPADWSIHAR